MRKVLWIGVLLLLSGCVSLREHEAKNVECRVLGVDASLPIPFAQGTNIFNIRLGWIETRYLHTYNMPVSGNVEQRLDYMGEVKREYKVGE